MLFSKTQPEATINQSLLTEQQFSFKHVPEFNITMAACFISNKTIGFKVNGQRDRTISIII